MRGAMQQIDAVAKMNKQIQLELMASSVYGHLQAYSDNEELKELWKKLAIHEKYHAAALERLRDTLSRATLEIETFAINPGKIDELLSELDIIIHEIKGGISSGRAFEIALVLEFSELNAIFFSSNDIDNKSPSLYIHSMGEGTKSHLTLLYKGMKKYLNTGEQAPHLQKFYEHGIINRHELESH